MPITAMIMPYDVSGTSIAPKNWRGFVVQVTGGAGATLVPASPTGRTAVNPRSIKFLAPISCTVPVSRTLAAKIRHCTCTCIACTRNTVSYVLYSRVPKSLLKVTHPLPHSPQLSPYVSSPCGQCRLNFYQYLPFTVGGRTLLCRTLP